MHRYNDSVKPEGAVQPGGQGEPKFTHVGGGDSGHPSMLEELARGGGMPGSFVVSRSCPESIRAAATAQGLRVKEHGRSIDGGFIMGPGLDDLQRVVGAFVGGEEQRHGAPFVACGDTSPCGGGAPSDPLPDHRAYDAAVRAESEKDAEAIKVRSLIRAWSLITEARQLLRDVNATEMSSAAQRAGGFVRIDREKPECRLCGRPRCRHRREVIEAVIMTTDGKVLCLTVET